MLVSGVGLVILFEVIFCVFWVWLIDYVGKEVEIDIISDIFMWVMGMKFDKCFVFSGVIVYMVWEFFVVKEFFINVVVGVVVDLLFVVLFFLLIYGIVGNVVWIIVLGVVLIVFFNIVV